MDSMSTDLVLYLAKPGEQVNLGRSPAGRFSLGGIVSRGETHESQPCLTIPVEAHPPDNPLTLEVAHVKGPSS